eukprot:20458-Eustigmatos_ZCMA.PRE.1
MFAHGRDHYVCGMHGLYFGMPYCRYAHAYALSMNSVHTVRAEVAARSNDQVCLPPSMVLMTCRPLKCNQSHQQASDFTYID